jgi:hypothetical protein
MHLPESIYRYAPYYWIVVGVLLALLGLDSDPGMFRYFSIALGALSLGWGVTVLWQRRQARQFAEQHSDN